MQDYSVSSRFSFIVYPIKLFYLTIFYFCGLADPLNFKSNKIYFIVTKGKTDA